MTLRRDDDLRELSALRARVAELDGHTAGYVSVTLRNGVARFVSPKVSQSRTEYEVGTAIDSNDGVRTHRVARLVLLAPAPTDGRD